MMDLPSARSPSRSKVTICVATYRRPQLLRAALLSIAEQRLDGAYPPQIDVLVGDNDGAGQGLEVVESLKPDYPWPIRGIAEATRGISFVRNTLVHAARDSDFVAFLDDDETAEPSWIDALCRTAIDTGAQAVLGPVRVRFEVPPPAWLTPLFADIELPHGATMPSGFFRTSNILLDSQALANINGPFDPAFALTGGSDYMLGQQLLARDASIVWASDAVVCESVPATRTTMAWYMQRRYRTGMTFSMAQQRLGDPWAGTMRGAYRGAGSILAGGLRLCSSLPRGRTRLAEAAGLIAYGVGNLAGVMGTRYEEYRTTHGR